MKKDNFLRFKVDNHNITIYIAKGDVFSVCYIYFDYNNNKFSSEFIYKVDTREFLYAKNKATDRQLKLIEKKILKEFK
jgi:hypothetical protein